MKSILFYISLSGLLVSNTGCGKIEEIKEKRIEGTYKVEYSIEEGPSLGPGPITTRTGTIDASIIYHKDAKYNITFSDLYSDKEAYVDGDKIVFYNRDWSGTGMESGSGAISNHGHILKIVTRRDVMHEVYNVTSTWTKIK